MAYAASQSFELLYFEPEPGEKRVRFCENEEENTAGMFIPFHNMFNIYIDLTLL